MGLKYVVFYSVLGLILGLFMVSPIFGQESNTEQPTVAPPLPNPRCFRYTWLGPTFTNASSFMNNTCDDVTHMATGRPCSEPLVVSFDGSWPNTQFIWANHMEAATCVLDPTDVCATWTEFYDGHVERVHHMCTRVTTAGGGVVTSGCFDETDGPVRQRICICRSVAGALPCNGAAALGAPLGLLTVLAATLYSLMAG